MIRRRAINISENGISRLGAGAAPQAEKTHNSAFSLSMFLATSLVSLSRPARSPTRFFGSPGVQSSRHTGEARFSRVRIHSMSTPSLQEFHHLAKSTWNSCFTSLRAKRASARRTRKSSSTSSSIFLDYSLRIPVASWRGCHRRRDADFLRYHLKGYRCTSDDFAICARSLDNRERVSRRDDIGDRANAGRISLDWYGKRSVPL